MGNVQEQAKELRAKIADAKSRGENVQILRAWAPVRAKLASFAEDSKNLSKATALLINEGVSLSTKQLPAPGELKSLKTKLEKLEQRLKDEPETFLDGNMWATAKAQLDGLGNSLLQNLTSAWAAYLADLGQNIDYLQPFANVDTCAVVIRRIKSELLGLSSLSESLPQNAEPFRQALRHQKEIQKLIQQLDLNDVPKGVEDFLKRVNTTGVTLQDLSTEILDWLRKKNMLRSFQIRAS